MVMIVDCGRVCVEGSAVIEYGELTCIVIGKMYGWYSASILHYDLQLVRFVGIHLNKCQKKKLKLRVIICGGETDSMVTVEL